MTCMNEHQWEQSEAIIHIIDVLHEVIEYTIPNTQFRKDLKAELSDASLMIQGGRIREREEHPEPPYICGPCKDMNHTGCVLPNGTCECIGCNWWLDWVGYEADISFTQMFDEEERN